MPILIRPATADDVAAVVAILGEAAAWVEQFDGTTMWVEGELADERIAAEVEAGQFLIAECAGEPAGVVRFQLQDDLFWPDLDGRDSAFVHRLAVRRQHAGRGVAAALLEGAAERARSLGRTCLRLDCDADRSRLRQLYERLGFRLHSYRQVGAYYVARYELPLPRRA